MPDTCVACPSGRKGSTYTGSYHTVKDEWRQHIPVKISEKNKRPRLYSLHFDPEDFQSERNDSNSSRHDARGGMRLKIIKEGRIPHIWPRLPSHYSKKSPPKRSNATLSETRRKKESDLAQKQIVEIRENDKISSLEDL